MNGHPRIENNVNTKTGQRSIKLIFLSDIIEHRSQWTAPLPLIGTNVPKTAEDSWATSIREPEIQKSHQISHRPPCQLELWHKCDSPHICCRLCRFWTDKQARTDLCAWMCICLSTFLYPHSLWQGCNLSRNRTELIYISLCKASGVGGDLL